MHKDEAASCFGILSNPNAVKTCKMLYVLGSLKEEKLLEIVGCDLKEFNNVTETLLKNNMIIYKNDLYQINKEYIDELLDFIKTPCGCAKK